MVDRLEQRRPYWRNEDEQQEIEEFQDRHQSFADKVERVLIQLVVLGLVCLVLVQGLQLNRLNRLAAMEGVPVGEVADWTRSIEAPAQTASGVAMPMHLKVMSVTRRSVPGAQLLLDGKPVGHFGTGSVSVDVRPGQVLAIDGTGYAEPLKFRVVETSGLSLPGVGATVTTQGDRQGLGIVRAGSR